MQGFSHCLQNQYSSTPQRSKWETVWRFRDGFDCRPLQSLYPHHRGAFHQHALHDEAPACHANRKFAWLLFFVFEQVGDQSKEAKESRKEINNNFFILYLEYSRINSSVSKALHRDRGFYLLSVSTAHLYTDHPV